MPQLPSTIDLAIAPVLEILEMKMTNIYIINVKSPNLEPQPQEISYLERERESVQLCQIKQDFRVGKKAETPNLLNI